MKTLLIVRQPTSDTGTHSVATIDALSFKGLECPWRNNQRMISCIKPGTYTATKKMSARFGRETYHLLNVDGHDEIEIHPANWAGDKSKGYRSDLEGCIALGLMAGIIGFPDGSGKQDGIGGSRSAMEQFEAYCHNEDIQVTIEWAPGAEPEQAAA